MSAEPAAGAVPMLADRMLGKLARMLRMVGQDVEYVREGAGADIARRAAAEGRVLLTRDRRLAASVDRGRVLYVENNYPFHQARQVLRALRLSVGAGFDRCVEDNGVLAPLAREDAAGRVPAYVLDHAPAFYRCDRCAKVYWEGTHVAAMRATIAALEDGPLVPGDPGEDEDGAPALDTLEPLVDLHQAMEVLLVQHRIALMAADLPRAARRLRRFSMCMRRHIADERALVLPSYADAAPVEGYERGAAPAIFETEHARILDHLAALETAVEALGREPASLDDLRARCLKLLDREKVFADLLEHHDLRERRFLYPALERRMTGAEKQDLVERMVGVVEEESNP